ncbi:MAG TPA: peptidase domain-containing ABC transporter [Bacteroides sp.]|nr:peptidase domain-containing ABC transporter [Bacteroides sp.]
MDRIRKIKQHDMSDCGAACLSSIAAAYGYHQPISKIRDMASTEKNGTNVMGLVEAAEKMGFLARGIKGAPDDLKSAPVPSIAHIITKKKFHHFVVLMRIGNQFVKIMDPEYGEIRKVPYKEIQDCWTGVIVVIVPGPEFRKKKANQTLAGRFIDLISPFRKTLLQALLGAIIYSLLGLSTSLFVQKIVDFVLVNRNLNLLNLLGTAMLFLLAIRILISWFKSIFLLKTGHQVDAGLIMGYYRHLLSLPQRFFDTMRTGEILSRMNDAIKIRVFLNHSLIEMVVAIMTIALTLLAMSFLSIKLCLMISAAIPIYIMLYAIFDIINKTLLRNLMEKSAILESQMVESIQSQRTIRAFGWKDWATNRTGEKLTGLLTTNYKAGIISILSSHSGELLAGLLTIILLWEGSRKVLEGYISPGELMSFYAMLGYLLGPMKSLGTLNRTMRDALIAADRLFQILDLELEENSADSIRIKHINRDIEFSDISFRYGSRPELFRNLNFRIPLGKTTGIAGKSGSGKSSIAALLRAEYLPSEGNLLINDCDIRQIEKTTLRKLIGIVPQQIELFSGSILENISPTELDQDKLLETASKTGLMQFVKSLPAGFSTEVGEHGIGLSGGEKQRIALTRALYHEPEILILDEATSALDPESESAMQSLFKQLSQSSMTLIIITHKLSLIRDADHIIMIDNGKSPESGNHSKLMGIDGLYRQLWSIQN